MFPSTRCVPGGRLFLLLALLLPAFFSRSEAQQLDPFSSGRRYLIVFPDTTVNRIDPRFSETSQETYSLYIYSPVDNNVTVVQGTDPATDYELEGGVFKEIRLFPPPIPRDLGTPYDGVYSVTSKEPIVLYCYMHTRFGTEAWAPLPVSTWGTEYYTAARPGATVRDYRNGGTTGPNSREVPAGGQIVVIAAQDSTLVRIFPNGTLANYTNTLMVLLSAGEAFQVQSLVDTTLDKQVDLGGSYITADKPIGVLTGNARTSTIDTLRGITGNAMKNAAFEWIAPAEQHGREFVYLPTMDGRQQNGSADGRRISELVRLYGTSADFREGYYTIDAAGNSIEFGVVNRSFLDNPNDTALPRYYNAEYPVMAVLNSPAVSRFNGTVTYSGGKTGSSYDVWGGFSVEMTPIEQWTTFAPIFVPETPTGAEHYVNVVTDENDVGKIVIGDKEGNETPFQFNGGKIGGPGLAWGWLKLTPGADYYIRSTDSTVTFGGFVYGDLKGVEAWRPITSEPEYEERMGHAYGYPLAPRRRILGSGDSIAVSLDTTSCCGLTARIEVVGKSATGLQSITLEEGSVNADLLFEAPSGPTDVLGAHGATVRIAPSIPAKRTQTVLRITDRTGRTMRIPFNCSPDSVAVAPSLMLDFGQIAPDTGCVVQEVTAINPLDRNVTVTGADLVSGSLASGNSGFRVISTIPILPATLPPGGLVTARICFGALQDDSLHTDTLRVNLECGRITLPLQAYTASPCLSVNDLDFGKVRESKTEIRQLRLCNQGTGTLRFDDTDGNAMAWLGDAFMISQTDRSRIVNARLEPGECITVDIRFAPDGLGDELGPTEATARFTTNSVDCVDSSLWTATVISDTASAAPNAPELSGYALQGAEPNPMTDRSEIRFSLGKPGRTVVTIHDASGREVETLLDAELEAGDHRALWRSSEHPSGRYFCTVTSGDWKAGLVLVIIR